MPARSGRAGTGKAQASAAGAEPRLRRRKANLLRFADDGETPNNPELPVVYYRGALALGNRSDPAGSFEELFASNGWRRAWRDSIYDFSHFHTRTHEVLGIARGRATIVLGGKRGRRIKIKQGDVLVLPAGTGHCRVYRSRDLLVVGAYPAGGKYNEPRSGEIDHGKATAAIAVVRLPAKDPVYGADGPLVAAWRRSQKKRPPRPARRPLQG